MPANYGRSLTCRIACILVAAAFESTGYSSPVEIRYRGSVVSENCQACTIVNPFGGFLSVGDSYEAVIRFDTESALLRSVSSTGARYDIVGGTASLSINSFTFTNDTMAPIIVAVDNVPTFDRVAIDISTVPVDQNRRPLAAGPHGVTEIAFGVQDNTGTALNSTSLPNHLSKIWNLLQRSELLSDPNGYCTTRMCFGGDGFPGIASLSIDSLSVELPEPCGAAMMLMSLGSIFVFGTAVRAQARRQLLADDIARLGRTS